MNTYTFSENLTRAMFATIGQLQAEALTPAGTTVRKLLDTIEGECAQQDQARAAKAEADRREAIKAELKAEADKAAKPKGDAVQTPAPAPAEAAQ